MAISIKETFQVQAPVDQVWSFMLDPRKVATCIPGAQLKEMVDARTFLGQVRVKLGAITASYEGRVRFERVDEGDHVVEMVADGRETSGATAQGTMSSRLRPLPDGGTEVVAEATINLTGRIMQVGGGMVQGVSHELFKQFAASVKERLEVSGDAPEVEAAPAELPPVRLLPLVLRAFWTGVVRFFQRLFRRTPA
jgi:uncharacterized protein